MPGICRAVEVLDLLAREPDLTMAAIRNRLGIPRSSLFNILLTLEHTGLVERRAETGRYRLGLRLLTLAGALQNSLDVREAAGAELRQLTAETQETTHLGVLEPRDLEVIYIDKIDSPQTVKLASYVGRKVPCYCTAMGKVLLAGLPDKVLRERLPGIPLVAMTPNTRTSLKQLFDAIAQVRRTGFAIDDEEHEVGVRCIAAPIYGATGEVVAAISVSGPTTRLSHNRLYALVPRIREAAMRISRRLGYAPGT